MNIAPIDDDNQSHVALLSPNQCYTYLPLPKNVLLLKINVILEFYIFERVYLVAIPSNNPFKGWN